MGIIIPIMFCFIDSYTYYYQDKLRGLMYNEEKKMKERHSIEFKVNMRFEKINFIVRILRSIFSYSNLLYAALLIFALFGRYFLQYIGGIV